ncbi:hypothetical protein U6A24_09785 [Aquimarina gracilis]|uniref:Lipoprotein n=1 Tax=Aquimarina gracilis TaxID=874422 RepID=A0ABU5ZVF7_9FLAO|nr:hypothetical protein [Aquimarina gracilis]MEB3345752.1 hypothetical protein [Aquimarina gracilis]
MKNLLTISLIFLISGCGKQKELLLHQKVEKFQVSECRTDCGIDSIGVRMSQTKNDGLKVKLGYIVNCSWKKGYLKNITEQNDTLIVKLDRPRSDNGEYPMTLCDCFMYFDFVVKDYNKKPKAIRVIDLFEENKYWDEKQPKEIVEDVEEEIMHETE